MPVRIQSVAKGSPAHKAGLCPGMTINTIDGRAICDGLDYEFYSTGARLAIGVEDEAGARLVTVEKDEYQPLGCEFESYLIDKQHSCCNRCVFCFIDQLPKGLRPPLYFKDDDERLGFLFGNYITLTNLSQRELERVIEMRFSPVNISVHTVNPQLRVEMMGNRFAGEVLEMIPRLAKGEIEMNFQLVLCPGLNDGEELRRSIGWLAAQGEACNSIAAVPVGLTRFREGLAPLEAYNRITAAQQLDIMLEAGDGFLKTRGKRLIYPSDEWFLLAGRPIPEEDFYEDYPQLENGVGMWRLLYEEFSAALDEALTEDELATATGEADVVVGELAYPLLQALAGMLEERTKGLRLHVHRIENHFFGRGVTVTGLLVGEDIIGQLKGAMKTPRLLLPEDVLRAEGDIMLDGTTPAEVAEALDALVQVVPKGGHNLLEALLES